MHDTAFEIGGLVMQSYCPPEGGDILELGSLSVNGTLRVHAKPGSRYIGMDFEAGESVDFVLQDGAPWPVEDASFDLVIASSVFEHDAMFWLTFIEMVRKARPGGFIYLNVPSNGWMHRYPLDCWRLYPESGVGLVRWAEREGLPVTLVESFVAERQNDVWNDFCAVFRREPSSAPLPTDFVHVKVPCANVISFQSTQMLYVSEATEDMRLIASYRQAFETAEASAQNSAAELEVVQRALTAKAAEVDALKQRFDAANDTLARLAAEQAAAEAEIARLGQEVSQLAIARTTAEAALERSVILQENALREVRIAMDAKRTAEIRLNERFAELSMLTALLAESEVQGSASKFQVDWLRRAIIALTAMPAWWAMMPRKWRNQRRNRKLRKLGLLDADAYLTRYPDIRAAGMDPLWHYVLHGIVEGRINDAIGADV